MCSLGLCTGVGASVYCVPEHRSLYAASLAVPREEVTVPECKRIPPPETRPRTFNAELHS